MFFWLGLMPCTVASKLWLLVEIAGFIWVIWMIGGARRPAPWIFAICLLAFFLFPPLYVHIILGQFSMLFVVLMIVKVYLPQASRWTPLLLAIGLTKPQLAILIYPGLLIQTWRQRGFRQAAWLVLSTVMCVLALTLPLFLFYPGWFQDFTFIIFDNFGKGWGLPTLFVQLPVLLGPLGYGIWGLVFVIALGITWYLWSTQDAKIALLASLALTPLVTIYASSWDFLLLLPAFFWLVFNLKSFMARFALLVGIIIVYIAQIAFRWQRDITDGSQWWIPPVMIGVYLLSLGLEHAGKLSLEKKSSAFNTVE